MFCILTLVLFMTVHLCQNSQNCVIKKKVTFTICKIYLNKPNFKIL